MNKHNILHITPHLGGGVGRVLLNYLAATRNDTFFEHKVICLDYANANAVSTACKVGIVLLDNMYLRPGTILEEIESADIVLVHWWNHPLLYDFLVRQTLPPSRVILWSHISGFHSPYVFTEKILKYPDFFVFTTPVSYDVDEVKGLTEAQKSILRVVWSTGGVEDVCSIKAKSHTGFNVGYIGTVDYCKMHPDFLGMCCQIKIPDVNFIVCGGPKEKEIRKEAEHLGFGKKFDFAGLVADITEYLPVFDIFGYPLAPYHYGTCEQALAEAMAAGIVPVVLSNRTESHMVKDGITGILAKDKSDYVNAIHRLYNDTDLRYSLSQNAKTYATQTFSLETMVREWEKIFDETLTLPKTFKKWEIIKNDSELSAKDVFLESLGNYGEDFISYCKARGDKDKIKSKKKIKKLAESANWQAETRGTVHHYNYFFQDDTYLSLWSRLMKESESV